MSIRNFIYVVLAISTFSGISYIVQLGSMSRIVEQTVSANTSWHIERDETFSDEFNALLDRCEKGDTQACDEADNTLYNFDDMTRVVYIADHRCEEGSYRQCSYIGEVYLHAIKGMTYDPLKAHDYLARGCEGGDQRGCDLLKEYRDVNGTQAHDRSTMAEELKRKCEQGNHDSCIDVAEMLHRGTGIKIDLDSALTYYKKGCDTPEFNTDPRCQNPYMIMEAMETKQ